MVAGQLLRELEASELVARDDAVHDACLLEDDEVPVHRALRETGAGPEHLGNRQWSRRGGEDVDDGSALRREPLSHASQSRGDFLVERGIARIR